MYPLIYHLGVDDYFPYEDFEPERFRHIRPWQRPARRRSILGAVAASFGRAASTIPRVALRPVRPALGR